MLYFSAFAMGIAGYYATLNKEPLLGASFLTSFGLSVLHHANYTTTDYLGGPWVAWIDQIVARWCYLLCVLKTYPLPFNKLSMFMYAVMVIGPIVYYKILALYKSPYRPYMISKRLLLHAVFMHLLPSFAMMLSVHERQRLGVQGIHPLL